MRIYVDIDETICISPENRNYRDAVPIQKHIDIINDLYDEGHSITYWTARGSGSGKDWREVTERQLEQWGALHHALKLGKPMYDLFIDDKVLNSRDFFESKFTWWPDQEEISKETIAKDAPQGAAGWSVGKNIITFYDKDGEVILSRPGRIKEVINTATNKPS